MGRESGLFVDGDCDGVVDIDHDAAVAITVSKALLLQLVLLYLCPLFTLRVLCVLYMVGGLLVLPLSL